MPARPEDRSDVEPGGSAGRLSEALAELLRARADVRASTNDVWWGYASWIFLPGARAAVAHRCERAALLASGRSWRWLRFIVRPALAPLRPAGSVIDPHARIGPGLRILHPELGVVIAGQAEIGAGALLIGGNCIGTRRPFAEGERFTLGSELKMGANAVVLGPVSLGQRVSVGAGAVVVRDAGDDCTLVGVPARPIAAAEQRVGG